MYEYNGELRDNKIRDWALRHQPKDTMLWKDSFWNFINFVEYNVFELMVGSSTEFKTFEDRHKYISEQYDIIGTHMSKSIVLPAIVFKYKGVEIAFRYNFYDWEVAVVSERDIDIPDGLFDKSEERYFYQGFTEKYKIKNCYNGNKSKFMARVNNNYIFYTLLFIIKSEIDKF